MREGVFLTVNVNHNERFWPTYLWLLAYLSMAFRWCEKHRYCRRAKAGNGGRLNEQNIQWWWTNVHLPPLHPLWKNRWSRKSVFLPPNGWNADEQRAWRVEGLFHFPFTPPSTRPIFFLPPALPPKRLCTFVHLRLSTSFIIHPTHSGTNDTSW